MLRKQILQLPSDSADQSVSNIHYLKLSAKGMLVLLQMQRVLMIDDNKESFKGILAYC